MQVQSSLRDCPYKWSATTACLISELRCQADIIYIASCHTVLSWQLLFDAAELCKGWSVSVLSHCTSMAVAVCCCRAAQGTVDTNGVLQQHALSLSFAAKPTGHMQHALSLSYAKPVDFVTAMIISCCLMLQSCSRDCRHKWSAATACPIP